jgi:hypothetical protein
VDQGGEIAVCDQHGGQTLAQVVEVPTYASVAQAVMSGRHEAMMRRIFGVVTRRESGGRAPSAW